jgi:signal transduction histidine kinase
LIPATFLAFIRCYPMPSSWPGPITTTVFLAVGATIATIGLSTPLLVHDVTVTINGLSRKTGPLYPFFLAYFVATWLAGLTVFFEKWQRLRGVSRAQMQHLGVAILISGSGAIAFNLFLPLLTGRSAYSWLGPYFSIPLVLIVGHAIIRHRLLDLRLVIGRTVAHALAISFLSVTAVMLVDLWAVPSDWVPLHSPRFAIAVVVALLMLSAPGQRALSRSIDPYLFRSRVDYSVSLREAARRFSRLMPLENLCEDLRSLLTIVFVPETLSIFVRNADTDRLELHAPCEIGIDASIVHAWLAENEEYVRGPCVVQLDQVDSDASIARSLQALRSSGIELAVVLGRRSDVLGVILLGARRSGDAYFKSDLEFIESLAELSSVALENALLYRQRLETLEYSQRLVDSLDAAVAAVDLDGRVTSLNRSAAHLFALEDRSPPLSLDAVPPEVAWALAIALRTEFQPRGVEVMIEPPGRGSVPVVLSAATLHDDRGLTRGALVVATDLTAVKALERNQRRIEHLTLMARFYAGIAHEIRSPLTAISNFVSLLTERFDDPDYRETAAKLLPLEVARIAQLADRLRLMAPSEGGQMGRVDLGSLLRDLVRLHAARSSEVVSIQIVCASDLPPIQGDARQLVQLFLNLLNNGIEAMPDGGRITIEALAIAQEGKPALLCVEVKDEGKGIDSAIIGKIFDPFFTTKSSGTGLGLSICREIADFHGATLALRKRDDRPGTVAEVRIPASPLPRSSEILKDLIADGPMPPMEAHNKNTGRPLV